MCEYMFTTLYQYNTSCILKYHVQIKKCRWFFNQCKWSRVFFLGKYSLCFWLFSLFLPPLYKRAHCKKNLVLLNCLKVCSAVLNQASCLLEHTIHYNLLLDFNSYFNSPKFFISCISVLGKEIKMEKKKSGWGGREKKQKTVCILTVEDGFCLLLVFSCMTVKNCRFLCFVMSSVLMI